MCKCIVMLLLHPGEQLIPACEFRSGLRSDVFGTQEFTMADLVTPERDPRRMKYFLSELINFYYFKCERQKELDTVNAEIVSRHCCIACLTLIPPIIGMPSP